MRYEQAFATLVAEGYGPVSARGLLLLAEQSGSFTDGNLTVRFTNSKYAVEA